ncbi:cell wall hydrolase [Clostridiales bacterium COT073_COT-073]|nr:cell wall hydrolase [Clostridiales bacterium COT073_COT-073]
MNFLKKLFSSLKQGHQKGLVIFAACCVIVVMLGVNGFVAQGDDKAAEQKIPAVDDQEQLEANAEDTVEEGISHYYADKIEEYISQMEVGEHILQIADNTEDRQFVTSGQLISRQAKDTSTEEYEILTRIVEAEAGGEPYETRLLVTNIILNRVENSRFPNSIKEVVFANNGKNYQFSPLSNGSYYRVKIQDSTCKAVDDALAGKDNSGGALYFMVRKWSTPRNIAWFDSKLTKVGQIGEVEYFK